MATEEQLDLFDTPTAPPAGDGHLVPVWGPNFESLDELDEDED